MAASGAADHVPVVRKRCAAQTGALPLALFQTLPANLLRSVASNPGQRRMGGMAAILSARCRRGQRAGNRHFAHPDAARNTSESIAENLGYSAGNGHRVLERLYERPIVSVNEVRELTRTTYPAANQLVERLVKIGVLSEMTGQARNRRFRYDAYVRLFDEPNANGRAEA